MVFLVLSRDHVPQRLKKKKQKHWVFCANFALEAKFDTATGLCGYCFMPSFSVVQIIENFHACSHLLCGLKYILSITGLTYGTLGIFKVHMKIEE